MIETAAVAAASAFLLGAWATRGRSSQVFGRSVWHGDRSRKALALTFDDGPTPGTLDLLETLDRLGVKATFFQIGLQAERRPEVARTVSGAGHEVGNHTYGHRGLWLKSPRAVREEVEQAQRVLQEIHGTAPRWFRAPYGVRWFGLAGCCEENNLVGAMWTTIARDWTLPAGRIAARIERGSRNGAIFCLHDGRGLAENPDIRPTIEAVRNAVPRLCDHGYQFVTLSNLLCPKNSSKG